MKSWQNFFFTFLAFVGAGALWQMASSQGLISASLFPPPSAVFMAFAESKSEFFIAIGESARAIAIGFFLSAVFGLLFSVVLTLFHPLKQAILPFAVFFQTVPIIAVAPLLVIYFGFGFSTVVACTMIVSLFPIIANSVMAFSATPANELELFRLYRASRWKTFYHLRLPAAYLGIYTGLQISAGLAVIGAVAGEFVAGGGLGSMIDSARTQQRTDIVFAALICLSGLGILFITSLRLVHYWIQSYRPLGLDLKE
jgi:NitT/TauT family transport system permease protein